MEGEESMSFFKKKWDLCLVIVLLIVGMISEYHEIFSFLEDQTLGIRHVFRMSYGDIEQVTFPQDKIVLVVFDEMFFDKYNAFPLRRQDIATIIDNINQLQPKLIAVDFLFKYKSSYDDDPVLAKAVESSNAILASQAVFDKSGAFETIHYPVTTIGNNVVSGYINHTSTSSLVTTLSRLRIFPEISKAPNGWPFAIQILARQYNSQPEIKDQSIIIGPHTIPLNQFNEIYIDFPVIPEGNRYLHDFAGITALAFMNTTTEDKMELSYWIKDKIVIIGDTFAVSQDWFDTPVGTMFGSEFIASAVSTILNGSTLRPASTLGEFLSCLCLLLLVATLCYRYQDPRLRVFLVTCLFISYFLFASVIYVYWGIIIAVSYPIIAGILSFTGINLKFYLRERTLKARAEKNFKKIFDNCVEGIFQATPDGQIITANPSMANILDYHDPDELRREITRFQDQIFVYPADFREFDRIICHDNHIENFETLLKTRIDRQIWGAISARVHYDSKSELKYYEGSLVDITLRKKAQENLKNLNNELEDRVQQRTKALKNTVDELSHTQQLVNHQNLKLHQTLTALKESEERYRGLYHSSKDGIFFLGMQMRFLDGNPAFESMLGYALQDLKQLYLRQVTPHKWHQIEKDLFEKQIFSGSNTCEYEKEFIHADGYSFPVSIRAWLLFHETGQPIGIWGIAHDISLKKRAENLRNDVERMVRHDLKSPLNGIISLTKRLQYEHNLNNKQKGWINMINESGLQILHMVEHSLDMYKMEEGTYIFKPLPVDLIRLFHRLNEEMMFWANKSNITLRFYLRDKLLSWDTLHWISGEEILLASLFSNLIKNAIEASPEDETVTISIYEKQMHEIKIHNMGMIPENIQHSFFERYVTEGKSEGTGLGTYSAKLIARVHGGDITFVTSPSEGTTLTVHLPIKFLNQDNFLHESQKIQMETLPDECRILSVDDHPNNHMIMEVILDKCPYHVTYVNSGKEALDTLLKLSFDVILMDLNMPEMNGFDCTQAIRDRGIQIPIIALSADNSQKTKQLCQDKGFNGFLAKPVQSLEAIIETIENVKLNTKNRIRK
jgi:PAS domain S-box-containing protein